MNDSKKPPVAVRRLPAAEPDPTLSAQVMLGDIPSRPSADYVPPFGDDEEHEAVNPEHQADLMLSYDDDIVTWSEHQAKLLRRHAAGELVNDAEIDWPNVAEEIEDVGSNRLHAVESLLVQALRHMLKAEAWPSSRDVPNWRADAIDFRRQARRRFVPSMRQKIDMAGLYADALAALPETVDGQPPLPVSELCPVTVEELLADD